MTQYHQKQKSAEPELEEPPLDDTGEHLLATLRGTFPGAGIARHASAEERELIRLAFMAEWEDLDEAESTRLMFVWTRMLLLWHGSWDDEGTFSWFGTGVPQEAIDAWNRMAEANVGVIRSIKKNEQRMRSHERQSRLRSMVGMACVLVLIAAGALTIHTALSAEMSIVKQAEAVRVSIEKMEDNQRASIEAVAAMTEAQAKGMEAQGSLDPAVEQAASDAALKAQEKSLETQKKLGVSKDERAAAAERLRAVKKKRSSE